MKWIVVVDQTEASIYRGDDFSLVERMKNGKGRLHDRALTRSKPGLARGKAKGGERLFAMTGGKDPHVEVAENFAKKISDFLTAKKHLNEFDDVVIVAEPRMEGRLRGHMNHRLKDAALWVQKDLRKLNTHELRIAIEKGALSVRRLP
jgi:protein required for attachment to host cells